MPLPIFPWRDTGGAGHTASDTMETATAAHSRPDRREARRLIRRLIRRHGASGRVHC